MKLSLAAPKRATTKKPAKKSEPTLKGLIGEAYKRAGHGNGKKGGKR